MRNKIKVRIDWNKVERIMKRKGITKSEMAMGIGISPQLLSYYFSSMRSTANQVHVIATGLSIKGDPVTWTEITTRCK